MIKTNTLAKINVDEGCIIKFDRAFLDYYGRDSIFVATLSDYFTTALAIMMENKGLLNSWDTVALFSTKSALKILSDYFSKFDEAKKAILQEAFGNLPVGSTEEICDKYFGSSSFKKMIKELEY